MLIEPEGPEAERRECPVCQRQMRWDNTCDTCTVPAAPKQERVFVPLWLTREEAETILHSGRSGWDKIVYARTEDAIRRALDGTAKAEIPE